MSLVSFHCQPLCIIGYFFDNWRALHIFHVIIRDSLIVKHSSKQRSATRDSQICSKGDLFNIIMDVCKNLIWVGKVQFFVYMICNGHVLLFWKRAQCFCRWIKNVVLTRWRHVEGWFHYLRLYYVCYDALIPVDFRHCSVIAVSVALNLFR